MSIRVSMLAGLLLLLLVRDSIADKFGCDRQIKGEGKIVRLDLTCPRREIMWFNPAGERVISFTNKKRSFSVCLDSASAGASVYRLEGIAKTQVSANSQPGHVGCFKSDCKHVTLSMKSSPGASTLRYTYTTTYTDECHKCTSECLRECFCHSPYVFVAQVMSTVKESRKLYRNYVKLRYFLKHSGSITNQLGVSPPTCPNQQPWPTTSTSAIGFNTHIPVYGSLKLKSKCKLQAGRTYLFSANLYTKRNHNGRDLILCCAEENHKYAWVYYSYLLNNYKCC